MAHLRRLASLSTRRSLRKSLSSYLYSSSTKLQNNVALCGTTYRHVSSSGAKLQPDTASITFHDRDGDKKTVSAKYGDSLLDVAKNNDIDLEGACEGTLSCSTCHLIFDPDEFAKLDLPEPDDEELDMLDLAYGLTPT
ncbi:uncharacterized protein LOC114541667 [Dendronephthya gigantea]|nr:uncharacterized protein LOC114541667 [Dendronephthya gigantea]